MDNDKGYIAVGPKVMLGKPAIKGTRITAEPILEKLAAGQTVEDRTESHSSLNTISVQAALPFALDNLRSHGVFPIGFHYTVNADQ